MCVLVWVFPAFYMFLWAVCFCMLLKVELIKSRPNKTGLNVRVHTSVYVRPSAKRFSDLNEIWYGSRGTISATRRHAV